MKKVFFLLFLIVLTSQTFSDEISRAMSSGRWYYLNKHYGQALKTQMSSLDRIFAISLTNTIPYIPKLKSMYVVQTNLNYSFSDVNGNLEYNLSVQKVMTNKKAQVAVTFDFSPLELDRYYSLFMSYDYLKNNKRLKKITFKKRKTSYDYILDNSSGIMLFVFKDDKENNEIISGMVLKIDLLPSKRMSKKKLERTLTQYFSEILSKLKLKSIKWRFR